MNSTICVIRIALCCLWINQKHIASSHSDKDTSGHTSDETFKEMFPTEKSFFNISEGVSMKPVVFSYAEWILKVRAGWDLDLKKLMLEYSMICPIQKSCNIDFDDKYLFTGDLYRNSGFKDCKTCQCDRSCVEEGNCCPGSHFGYVPHGCTNTLLFPKEETETVYTVGTCLDEFKDNNTLVNNCKSDVLPCTSSESGLVYKNKHCAQCNGDNNCVNWSLDVDCSLEGFSYQNFNSYADIKAGLELFGCKVQYKPTTETNLGVISCDKYDYQKKIQIDRCNVTACKHFPVSERLRPFKNIYCYACSFGYALLTQSETNVSVIGDISEFNDFGTLRTKIDISLVFPYENNDLEVQSFVRDSLNGALKHVDRNSKVEENNSFNITNIDDIIKLYVTVCGNGLLCTDKRKENESYFSNPVCKTCSCDFDCAEYEICCLDTTLLKQPFTCLNSKTFPLLHKHTKEDIDKYFQPEKDTKEFKVIDTCLNKTHELADKCSVYSDTDDFFADVPISTYGTVAYRNIYCYKCNNENTKPIVLDFQVYCNTFIEYNLFTDLEQFLNILMTQCQTISFLPLKTKTCKDEYDALSASYVGGEYFTRIAQHPSTLHKVVTVREHVLASHINDSVKQVFSSCNMSGYQTEPNIIVENICESNSLTILSLPEYRFDKNVYKNFACFLCNPEIYVSNIGPEMLMFNCSQSRLTEWYEENSDLEEFCDKTPIHERWVPFKNMYCAECILPPWQLVKVHVDVYDMLSPPFYKYIFSLSPEDFNKIDEDDDVMECHNGTYDYNLKQCRSLYCQNGTHLYQSTCKPFLETASNHLYMMKLYFHIKEMDGIRINNMSSIRIDLKNLCFNISTMITDRFEDTTMFSIQEMICIAYSPCLTTDITDKTHVTNIAVSDIIDMSLAIYIRHTKSISQVREVLINALSETYEIPDLTDLNASMHSVLLEPVKSDGEDQINPESSCVFLLFTLPGPFFKLFQVSKFLQCAFVKFDINDTIIFNETLIIAINGKNVSFSEDEYEFQNDEVTICIEDFNAKTTNFDDENTLRSDSSEYVNALNIFTRICTIFSMSCIFVTFVTYCLFPSLRTIPGKCVMLLCFSLFFAQASLQFGLDGSSRTIFCVIIGIANHYFWLALFCAMNISSFHMFRVFYFSDLLNQVSQNKTLLFVKYFLYFILWPLVFVLVTVIINLFHSDMTSVGYGDNYCFISDFYIFIGTFLIPACLICLSNFIFFSLAFHKIRSTPDIQSNQDKNNFYIFLKLSIIVGITWPLLIIDNIINLSWFSFAAAGINSLQGVFVFISFILNKRVIYLYKAKCVKSTDKGVSRSDSGTTYSIINRTKV